MKIIEFTGIPGSGKSMLYNEVLQTLKNNNFPTYQVMDLPFIACVRNKSFAKANSLLPHFVKNRISNILYKKLEVEKKSLLNFIKNNPELYNLVLESNKNRLILESEKKRCFNGQMRFSEGMRLQNTIWDKRNGHFLCLMKALLIE